MMFNFLVTTQHQHLWGKHVTSRLHQTLECIQKQSFAVTTMALKHVFDCGTTNSQVAIDGRDKEFENEYSPRETSLVEMSDRRAGLLLRSAAPKAKPKLLIKEEADLENKRKHFDPPAVTIWDALLVGVGSIQLIGSLWEYATHHLKNAPIIGTVIAVAQQQKGLLPYFWNYWKVIFHLPCIFGPLVYLRNSADDFKCEMIVGERNCHHDDKYASRTKNTNRIGQEVVTTATRQKQRQKSSPISRLHFLCRRRELVAAAAVGSAALLSVVSAICKLLLLSSDGNTAVEISYLSECAATLESASVHMYLVSAIFTLWKSPRSWVGPWSFTNGTPWHFSVGSIETLGDAFFGAASVVDVWLQHSTMIVEGIHRWCVVSALLWTCSSWFYVLAKSQR